MAIREGAKAPRRNADAYRTMRQIHLWVGAWGALAAVLFGTTGLVMNHRFALKLPQGGSVELRQDLLQVPGEARATPQAMMAWLDETHGLRNAMLRGGPPGAQPAPRWSINGGDARQAWALEYEPGAGTATVRHFQHGWLAAFNRLHKTVGGGTAWILLSDSFALAMTLLGISGLWMWARGRRPRTVVLSVLGVSVLALAAVLGPALF
jgi:uncharacterized protein